jgi:hypothetical protein
MDGTEPAIEMTAAPHLWPGEDTLEPVETEEGLWGRSRDFDWGD